LRFWSTQAREPEIHYEHKEIGYNYRMSNICAGIGRGQLKVIDKRIKEKKRVREKYEEGLKDLPISFMPVFEKGSPNYWLTVITIEKDSTITPKDIILALEKENIESRPVWKPMHMQSIFANYDYIGNYISKKFFRNGVCLPSGTNMKYGDFIRIFRIIQSSMNRS